MNYGNSVTWGDAQEEEIFGTCDKFLLARFKKFHLENPEFFIKFREYTNELQKSGRGFCSAWWIVNRIRWEVLLVTTGEDFKINNDFVALYPRLLIWTNPKKYSGFFRIKSMKAARKYSQLKTGEANENRNSNSENWNDND